jgi:uncharacterized protein YjbI with pentapeptide repeats
VKIVADNALILDLFINRDGYVENAEDFFRTLHRYPIEAYITERCLDTIRFYLGKPDREVAETAITKISALFNHRIIPVDFTVIDQARTLAVDDFEAAIEVSCANTLNIGAIVTQNPDKFAGSNLLVLSINELNQRQNLEGSLSHQVEPLRERFERQLKLISPLELTSSQSKFQSLIQKIAEADTEDFFELAALAGLNPLSDFSGANLTQVDLHSAQLMEANFIKTNLSYADLTNANLENARLISAQLHFATLTGANLNHAELSSANLTQATLMRVRLLNADLTRAVLSNATLDHVDLRRATLTAAILENASLDEALLHHATLRRANLCNANLSGASLYGADLRNCDLRGADLSAANLTGAIVKQALFGENPGLSSAMADELRQRGALFYAYQ